MIFITKQEEQILAAARSRSRSNNAPRCHSLRSRRFATLPYQVRGNRLAIQKQTIKTKPIISSKLPPIDIGEIDFTVSLKHPNRVRNSNTAFCVGDQKALCPDRLIGAVAPFLARGREGVKGGNPLTRFLAYLCRVAKMGKNKSQAQTNLTIPPSFASRNPPPFTQGRL